MSNTTLLANLQDKGWNTFLKRNASANIFHHPAWIQLLVDCYKYKPFVVIAFNSNGEICAGTPILQINSRITGRRWVSLPFSDYCTPLYSNDKALSQLTNNLIDVYNKRSIPKMELRGEYPLHSTIQRSSFEVLHTIILEPDPEIMFKKLHKMHQRNIKKAQKEDIYIERCTTKSAIDLFYNLHLQTRRRQGVPIQPKKFFDSLRKNIIDRGLGYVSLAYKGNDCVAGSIFLHWGQTLTYKYGASNDLGRDLRANHLVMWSAIRWGCENGYKLFDMGKTDNDNAGLRRFKSMWGAVEKPLIYSTLSSNPPQPMSSKLHKIMQTIIQNTHPWVCRITGELLYRHFG